MAGACIYAETRKFSSLALTCPRQCTPHLSPPQIESLSSALVAPHSCPGDLEMPLCLVELPIEVIAIITFHLPPKDILESLFGIGNALLTHKLCQGGVVDLAIRPSELSGGTLSSSHLVACQSLSLRTLNLYGIGHSLANKLVLGLKPTLRHLSGSLPSLIDPEIAPELAGISLLSDVGNAIWNVRSTFPELETLQIDFRSRPNALFDPVSAARFFAGLPSTLTALNVPSSIPFNFWPLLPPSVTLVYGADNNFPPLLDAAPNLTSLQSLEFSASPKRSPDPTEILSDFWRANEDETNVRLPPHLTSLDLTGSTLILTLPSTLTHLRYENYRRMDELDILVLMKALPLSMVSFDVLGGTIKSLEHNLPVLRLMKRFRLHHKRSDISLFSPASFAILDCIPNVEELVLSFDRMSGYFATKALEEEHRGLDVQHLRRLNTRTLRLLDADFKPSCFKAAEDGTYPLDPFVKLRTLLLENAPEQSNNFTFAAIPSSVTSISLKRGAFSSETLHLLPASVTDLRTSLRVRPEDYLGLVSPHRPSSSSAESMDVSELPVEHSFDYSTPECFLRRFKTEGSEVSNGVVIESRASSFGPILLWMTYPPFVPSLTSLRLDCRNLDLDWTTFTQSSLPNLRHLGMRTLPLSGDFDLSSWTSLRSLDILNKDRARSVRCPPGLTKLELKDSTLLSSFMPLPPSLTEILCESLAPYRELADLKNLRSFECRYKLYGNGASDILPTLSCMPKGLTSLLLPNFVWGKTALVVLRTLLPSLERVKLPSSTFSISALDSLYHGFSGIIETTEMLLIEARPDEAARLLNVPLGSIFIPKNVRPDFWCHRAFKEAYPRVIGKYALQVRWVAKEEAAGLIPEDEDDDKDETNKKPNPWMYFAPYLSPDTEELVFDSIVDFLPDFPKTLPRGLKTLKVRCSLLVLDDVSRLPPTLTKLHMGHVSLNLGGVSALPRSLTSLQVGQLVRPVSDDADPLDWPPGLTEMGISIADHEDLLSMLPSSLTMLQTSGLSLTLELLKSLPVGLKYYQDKDEHPWNERMLSLALERNLTRLSQIPKLRVPFIDPTLVLDQVLASLQSGTV